MLVSPETAKLAKEKGYSVGSSISYTEYHSDFVYDGDPTHLESHKCDEVRVCEYFHKNNFEFDYSNEHFTTYEAPTQSQLQDWLRKAHGILITPISACSQRFEDDKIVYMWKPSIEILEPLEGNLFFRELKYELFHDIKVGLSYEDVFEIGLQKALTLI